MNILCLKDNKIDDAELKEVYHEVFEIYRDNSSVEPQLFTEARDFTDLPFVDYWKDAPGIDKSHIKSVTKDIKKRWGYEVDLVDFMVHEENWEPMEEGIYGWNIASSFSGYEVEQTRFDAVNHANSVGTLYHEIMHSHDSFVKRMVNTVIEKQIGVDDWDDVVVHGNGEGYEYIRYKENKEVLQQISTELASSFAKRRELQKEREQELLKLKGLLQRLLDLYINLSQTKQDKPITSKCIKSWKI